jgi:diacylglycerol kinase family enzyme
MTDYTDLDALFAEMDIAAERARLALEGSLATEYKGLRSLDPDTIKDITPDTTDEAIYEHLMAIVQEASARNESQAQLASRIRALGGVAIQIAKRVPSLLAIL